MDDVSQPFVSTKRLLLTHEVLPGSPTPLLLLTGYG